MRFGEVVNSKSKMLDVDGVTLVGLLMSCVNENSEQTDKKFDDSLNLSVMM